MINIKKLIFKTIVISVFYLPIQLFSQTQNKTIDVDVSWNGRMCNGGHGMCFINSVTNKSTSNTQISFDSENNELILTELSTEINATTKYYGNLKQDIYNKLNQLNKNLVEEITLKGKLNLLLKKDQLKEELEFLKLNEISNINKIRYLKGLSIIRILYEKVLALDHHFSSIATFNEINKISNPNNYQEFTQVKDLLKSKKDKKKSFQLTSLLGQNIYTSSIDMFINLFNSSATPKEKELEKIECILDFTLRMNNDY